MAQAYLRDALLHPLPGLVHERSAYPGNVRLETLLRQPRLVQILTVIGLALLHRLSD